MENLPKNPPAPVGKRQDDNIEIKPKFVMSTVERHHLEEYGGDTGGIKTEPPHYKVVHDYIAAGLEPAQIESKLNAEIQRFSIRERRNGGFLLPDEQAQLAIPNSALEYLHNLEKDPERFQKITQNVASARQIDAWGGTSHSEIHRASKTPPVKTL